MRYVRPKGRCGMKKILIVSLVAVLLAAWLVAQDKSFTHCVDISGNSIDCTGFFVRQEPAKPLATGADCITTDGTSVDCIGKWGRPDIQSRDSLFSADGVSAVSLRIEDGKLILNVAADQKSVSHLSYDVEVKRVEIWVSK